jgi:signal transduction histidine kinase
VDAINSQIERINRLLDDQRRFIAIAAHELRSPLTALSLQAQNVKGALTPEAMRERVEPLMEGIERSRHLLEQLMSHAQAQSALMKMVEADVVDVLRMVVNGRIEIANSRGIEIDFMWGDINCHTRNRAGFRLIVENALDNALRYAPTGGTITIRGGPCHGGFYLEVVDEGPGIPEAEHSKVFQPFYRIIDRNDGGSGLGLAIAKEAANQSGGRIILSQATDSGGLIFRYEEDPTVSV